MSDSSLLIKDKEVKITFGADTKASFANYFQNRKIHFILVFVTNYPISWQLLMDIIFGYPLIGQFDTI